MLISTEKQNKFKLDISGYTEEELHNLKRFINDVTLLEKIETEGDFLILWKYSAASKEDISRKIKIIIERVKSA